MAVWSKLYNLWWNKNNGANQNTKPHRISLLESLYLFCSFRYWMANSNTITKQGWFRHRLGQHSRQTIILNNMDSPMSPQNNKIIDASSLFLPANSDGMLIRLTCIGISVLYICPFCRSCDVLKHKQKIDSIKIWCLWLWYGYLYLIYTYWSNMDQFTLNACQSIFVSPVSHKVSHHAPNRLLWILTICHWTHDLWVPMNINYRTHLWLVIPKVLAVEYFLKVATSLVQICTHCHQAYRQCRRLTTLTEVNSTTSTRYQPGRH